jgi:hypothetical protein
VSLTYRKESLEIEHDESRVVEVVMSRLEFDYDREALIKSAASTGATG